MTGCIKYFQVQLEHRKDFVDFKSISKTKWDDKKLADDTLKSVQRAGIATVTAVANKTVSEQPPLLFDLTGLQKEANKRAFYTTEETLNIAQNLYEKKFITYPRIGSKYIPEDMWAEIPVLVRALETRASCKEAVEKVKWIRFNKRIVNDVKVTDHHGLLITEKIPSGLSTNENVIYDMIAHRLLEALSPACSKEITNIELQALHYDFTLKGCKILEAGWRGIRKKFTEEDSEPIQELPELEVGDELKIKEASVVEKKTKPPALYTEASLLSAMENAGKEVDNEDGRKALRDIGIGTPATRASIIETLFKRDYIRREKKSLVPTDKGLQVYRAVKDRRIADIDMTAEWEMVLQKIENNEADATVFLNDMKAYATSVTRELLDMNIVKEEQPELTCPKCKSHQLLIWNKIVKCPNEACGWIQFRNVCGVQLSISDIESLVTKGKTNLIKGMKSKSGKKYNACIIMDSKGEHLLNLKTRNQKGNDQYYHNGI